MATATAMYHTGKNPLKRIRRDSETVETAKGEKQRRLHKAFLRYHDPANWPLLREALALFQEQNGLEVNGEPDEVTRDKLVEIYGS